MGISVLLDTNIIIAALKNDRAVQEQLATAENLFIPATVIGELLYGAHNARVPEQELGKLEAFLSSFDETAILACDHATAQVYGWLKHQRSRVGRPIPENDFWIASIAYQYDLPLATRDAHFRDLEGITVVAW